MKTEKLLIGLCLFSGLLGIALMLGGLARADETYFGQYMKAMEAGRQGTADFKQGMTEYRQSSEAIMNMERSDIQIEQQSISLLIQYRATVTDPALKARYDEVINQKFENLRRMQGGK